MSSNPWPADLTPDQVADAQAAIAAYRGYWQMVDLAAAQPGQDWTLQVAQFTTGPAKDSLIQTLEKLVDRGQISVGATGTTPLVIKVESGIVAIADCVDKTATDALNSSGNSVKAPNSAGSFFRHPSTVQMARLPDGRWVVAFKSDDWSRTC